MRHTVLFMCLFAVLSGTRPGWGQTVIIYPPAPPTLESRVQTLEATVARLTRYIQVIETAATSTYHGLNGPHVVFTGANVHIRSGSGVTYKGRTVNNEGVSEPLGLGNLIIGYNEANTLPTADTARRGGSHNLVVGSLHQYPSSGGLVAGHDNVIHANAASVSGGYLNTASNRHASVSGGVANTASGPNTSVSGGVANTASGPNTSVSGGYDNIASGSHASVSGGVANTASGPNTSVSGGVANTASGPNTSVSGGYDNMASGPNASVSGGYDNMASGPNASVSGGYDNMASGPNASVSGGYDNMASGPNTSVSGGQGNTARHNYASVSGGWFNTASGKHASVSGGINNTASGLTSSVSGGVANTANGSHASVSGGSRNSATARAASVSGGHMNIAGSRSASVLGGLLNVATSTKGSTVIGGSGVTVAGVADFRHLWPDCLTTEAVTGQTTDDVVFEGCNVHVRNGHSTERTTTTNGLGNLIVGYNEDGDITVSAVPRTTGTKDRSGSHNLVIGPAHEYSGHSGLVAGSGNIISGDYAERERGPADHGPAGGGGASAGAGTRRSAATSGP